MVLVRVRALLVYKITINPCILAANKQRFAAPKTKSERAKTKQKELDVQRMWMGNEARTSACKVAF